MSNIGCILRLVLMIGLIVGGMILAGFLFGPIGGFVYMLGIAALIIQYDKRQKKKDAEEHAKRFADVACTINAAYPYTDTTSQFEAASDEKLIAVDITWKGPSDETDIDMTSITNPDSADPNDSECYRWCVPGIAFLDPATGRPVGHLPYRLPSEFRFLLVYTVKSSMTSFKLSVDGWEMTPEPVRIAEAAPPNAPHPTQEDFERYDKVHDEADNAQA